MSLFAHPDLFSTACLRGLHLICGARLALDRQLSEWFAPTARPIPVLRTKADKLTRSEATLALELAGRVLERNHPGPTLQLFSSATREGVAAPRTSSWTR